MKTLLFITVFAIHVILFGQEAEEKLLKPEIEVSFDGIPIILAALVEDNPHWTWSGYAYFPIKNNHYFKAGLHRDMEREPVRSFQQYLSQDTLVTGFSFTIEKEVYGSIGMEHRIPSRTFTVLMAWTC